MSKEEDRIKNSRRRQLDDNAVNRQVKIALTNHAPVDEPHKFAKHHAMNCGDPRCVMCVRILGEHLNNSQHKNKDFSKT